jgi:hypothetical protein
MAARPEAARPPRLLARRARPVGRACLVGRARPVGRACRDPVTCPRVVPIPLLEPVETPLAACGWFPRRWSSLSRPRWLSADGSPDVGRACRDPVTCRRVAPVPLVEPVETPLAVCGWFPRRWSSPSSPRWPPADGPPDVGRACRAPAGRLRIVPPTLVEPVETPRRTCISSPSRWSSLSRPRDVPRERAPPPLSASPAAANCCPCGLLRPAHRHHLSDWATLTILPPNSLGNSRIYLLFVRE